MSVRTITSTSCYIVLSLVLIRYLHICDGTPTERSKETKYGSRIRREATIPQGTLRGINMATTRGRKILGFIGIPYAKPPVGDLRFKAPIPADPWTGILDADEESELCSQLDASGKFVGNEDCLYLNVFTPQLPPCDNSTLLPVMVFVIGGGFKGLNNSLARFGPDVLLEKDVVLVIPNYRVGVFGFLSTGDEVAPGNYALKDILQVLKWVQDSIRYLGGDPNAVTLFGGSSGAMIVNLLALSNSTDGLIHRYITQSGSALASIINQPREATANRAIQLGNYLGCPTNTSRILVNCLMGLHASEIVNTESLFYVWRTVPNNVWFPVTEPDIEGALIVDSPVNLMAAGKIRDLPWIAIVNRDEGINRISMEFFELPNVLGDLLDNIDLVLPIFLEYDTVIDDIPAFTNALKSYYLNDLTAERNLLLSNLTKLIGDALFIYPTYNAFKQQLNFAKSPQYLASFEYRGTFSNSYLYSNGSTKYKQVVHGDEMLYLFDNHDYSYGPRCYERNEADWIMVDTMVQLWTSFATEGIPTTDCLFNTAVWEPYSSLNNYLRIGNGSDTSLEMQYDLYIDRMRFWESLTAANAASCES